MVHNQTAHHFSVTHWYKSIFFTRQMIEKCMKHFFLFEDYIRVSNSWPIENFSCDCLDCLKMDSAEINLLLTQFQFLLRLFRIWLESKCQKYFSFTIWFENSIKTALQICNLWTGRPVSLNWFRLNFLPKMATIFHICKWQNFFTYANGYLLPFQLLS